MVVPDTNILWHEDKTLVVAPDFETFWSECATDFDLTLVLPEVVIGELLFQQTTSALKALAKANEEIERAAAIAEQRYAQRIGEARVRRDVKRRMARWVQQKRGVVCDTPVDEIDWAALVEDSLWRNPPFLFDAKNPKNEKGLRDRLIVEILESLCNREGAARHIAFITNDSVLREEAERRTESFTRCICYESLDDFRSYLRLTKEQLDEQFIKAIRIHATRKFFTPHDTQTFWYSEGIHRKIREQFKEELGAPGLHEMGMSSFLLQEYAPKLSPVTSEQIMISGAQFERLDDPRDYFWKSEIRFVQVFAPVPPSESPSFFASSLFDNVKTLRYLRQIVFSVIWKAQVRADGRFYDLALIEIQLSDRSINPAAAEDLEKYKLRLTEGAQKS